MNGKIIHLFVKPIKDTKDTFNYSINCFQTTISIVLYNSLMLNFVLISNSFVYNYLLHILIILSLFS